MACPFYVRISTLIPMRRLFPTATLYALVCLDWKKTMWCWHWAPVAVQSRSTGSVVGWSHWLLHKALWLWIERPVLDCSSIGTRSHCLFVSVGLSLLDHGAPDFRCSVRLDSHTHTHAQWNVFDWTSGVTGRGGRGVCWSDWPGVGLERPGECHALCRRRWLVKPLA